MAVKRGGSGGVILTKTSAEPIDIDDLFERPDDRKNKQPVRYQSTNVLVIGDQATYKTKSLETIPKEIIDPKTGEFKEARVLHIDADDRSAVIDRAKAPHFEFIRIPYDPADNVGTWERYNGLIERLRNKQYEFNVGILDTLSPLAMTAWDLSWEEPPIGVGTLRMNKRGEAYHASRYTTDYTNGADMNYEFVKQEMRRIIFALMRRFDYFICTAHLKNPYFGDAGTAKEKFTADLQGGLKDVLPRMFQEVYFTVKSRASTDPLVVANQGWCWQTQPANKKYARTCLPIPANVPMDYGIIMRNEWQRYVDSPVEAAIEEQEDVS